MASSTIYKIPQLGPSTASMDETRIGGSIEKDAPRIYELVAECMRQWLANPRTLVEFQSGSPFKRTF